MGTDNDQGDVSRRALRVMRVLQQLWGDDLPPGPDAELTILIDALAARACFLRG